MKPKKTNLKFTLFSKPLWDMYYIDNQSNELIFFTYSEFYLPVNFMRNIHRAICIVRLRKYDPGLRVLVVPDQQWFLTPHTT
jgi:hypothetical protein